MAMLLYTAQSFGKQSIQYSYFCLPVSVCHMYGIVYLAIVSLFPYRTCCLATYNKQVRALIVLSSQED